MNASVDRVLVCCALPREAAALGAPHLAIGEDRRLGDRLRICVTGVGPDAASQGATRLLSSGDAQDTCVISAGVAGGLSAALGAGDVVVASSLAVEGEAASGASVDPHWSERLRQALATLAISAQPLALTSTREVVATAEAKRALHLRTGAAAVDMESIALAAVAAREGRAFCTLRVVIDDAQMALPQAALVSQGSEGETRIGPLLASLTRRPGELPDLLSLGRAWNKARASLEVCGKALRSTLGATSPESHR